MRGFSLVELSIVLVILGLLTGGILAGQSLIRAAELRSVSTDYQRYLTASHSFRDKYFWMPGDFRDGTKFWARQVAAAHCASNSGLAVAGTPGTCDGNGDSTMEWAPAASQSAEIYQFWRQLTLAGLLEGSYSGMAGAGGTSHCNVGTDCPKARLPNAGWGIRQIAAYFPGNAGDWAGNYGIFLDLGAGSTTGTPQGSVLKPEELWNIDTKMDDGRPGVGKIIAAPWANCSTATTATDFSATYKLSETNVVCMAHFMRIF